MLSLGLHIYNIHLECPIAGGALSFRDVVANIESPTGSMTERLPPSDVSCSYYLICLLHLANEKVRN